MTSISDTPAAVPPTEPAGDPAPAPKPKPKPEKQPETWWSFLRFLLILFLATLFVRSCVAAPFMIPSGSMLPNLMIGDYLFVSKWNYGYSQYSYPFGIIRYEGRVMGSVPERGDIVVFRYPGASGEDYVKRVVALPGDTVEVRDSLLYLNGQPVGRERIADFVQPVSENMTSDLDARGPCRTGREEIAADGARTCHYLRYRETLPTGRSYDILDAETHSRASCGQILPQNTACRADNFGPTRVPDNHVFVMGDNRDDSQDSRFPVNDPAPGVGMLPIDNIQGRALISFFSTDGSAEWLLPWTWFSAARWSRFGMTYP